MDTLIFRLAMTLGIKVNDPFDVCFDNKQWILGNLVNNSTRKSSKEYFIGMMGIENNVVKQISQAKWERRMMPTGKQNNIKRQGVRVLYKLSVT